MNFFYIKRSIAEAIFVVITVALLSGCDSPTNSSVIGEPAISESEPVATMKVNGDLTCEADLNYFSTKVVGEDYHAAKNVNEWMVSLYGKPQSSTGFISDTGGKNFAKHQRAWDESIRLLADHYDNSDSIRMAIRPYGEWWVDDYIWLLQHVQALGYKFGNYENFNPDLNANQKTVYLRYDVHLRDISPLYIALDVNQALGIPSVSFIQWDSTLRHTLRRRDFLNIKKFEGPLNLFALHLSPIPSYLEKILREEDSTAELGPWVTNGGLEKYLLEILSSSDSGKSQILKIRRESTQWALATSSEFKKVFPRAKLISYHGSHFERKLRSLCLENANLCSVMGQMLVSSMPEELTSAFAGEWRIVDELPISTATDSLKTVDLLCQLEKLTSRGKAFSLLVHPAQLYRNRREYAKVGISPGESMGELCR